jgi:hypothetical protein
LFFFSLVITCCSLRRGRCCGGGRGSCIGTVLLTATACAGATACTSTLATVLRAPVATGCALLLVATTVATVTASSLATVATVAAALTALAAVTTVTTVATLATLTLTITRTTRRRLLGQRLNAGGDVQVLAQVLAAGVSQEHVRELPVVLHTNKLARLERAHQVQNVATRDLRRREKKIFFFFFFWLVRTTTWRRLANEFKKFLQVLHTSAGVLGQKEVHARNQNTLCAEAKKKKKKKKKMRKKKKSRKARPVEHNKSAKWRKTHQQTGTCTRSNDPSLASTCVH